MNEYKQRYSMILKFSTIILSVFYSIYFLFSLMGNSQKDKETDKVNYLNRKALENKITLVKNDRGIVPFYRLDTLKFAVLSIGNKGINTFQQTLKLYADITCFNNEDLSNVSWLNYNDSLEKFNLIFISIHQLNDSTQANYGVSNRLISFVDSLAKTKTVILDIFGSPKALRNTFNLEKIKAILVSYEDSENSQDLSAQLLFGGIPAKGKLPVAISEKYIVESGVQLSLQIRLKYTTPEEVHAKSSILARADSMIIDAIKNGAFPGCQVLAAKDGKVFYNKTFGYHTYNTSRKVGLLDLYDIASITKVASTTVSLMKLYDDNKLDPDEKVAKYLQNLDSTDKRDILIKEVLTHCAGLTPYLLFWAKTVTKKDHKWKDDIYCKKYSENYPFQVADSMFIRKDYPDSMYSIIAKSKLLPKKSYKYSDNGMYLMKKIIEKVSSQSLDKFADSSYYHSLGAYSLCYNPLHKFSQNQIIPTENDTNFRKQLIHGYVHDPGAAMLGGVGGHAGLFSNANDLAKLFQMLLNKGTYGGKQYLKKETIEVFNSSPYLKKGNRRALGFDKPEPNKKKENPVFKCVSVKAFGHQGFTGTVVWADPENGILFVFLSNRVYPSAENKVIGQLSVRAKVQSIIYEALK